MQGLAPAANNGVVLLVACTKAEGVHSCWNSCAGAVSQCHLLDKHSCMSNQRKTTNMAAAAAQGSAAMVMP